MGEWISKMWYIHAMEYYLALKRKEILTQAATWMNLRDITLSEINPHKKTTYDSTYRSYLKQSKIIKTESVKVIALGAGEGDGKLFRDSVLQDKKSSGDGWW